MSNNSGKSHWPADPFKFEGVDPPQTVPPKNPFENSFGQSQQQPNPANGYPPNQNQPYGWGHPDPQQPLNNAPPIGNFPNGPSSQFPGHTENFENAGNFDQRRNSNGQYNQQETNTNHLNFPNSSHSNQMEYPQQNTNDFEVREYSGRTDISSEHRGSYFTEDNDGDYFEDDSGNNQVYYEPESDSDEIGAKGPSKKRGHPSSRRGRPSHQQAHSSKGKPTSKSSKPGKISLISNVSELTALGTFESLEKSDRLFEIIKKYVKNSCSSGKYSGDVKVHGISRIPKGFFSKPLTVLERRLPKMLVGYKMLLWFKTTRESVKHLAQRDDKCVAFYDRVVRAFPLRPEDLTKPQRMTLILCSVDLGTYHTSDKGYRHWSRQKGIPNACNSVRGCGRFISDWSENEEDGTTIVPCGKTKPSRQGANSKLDYNEYMVFEARRVKVKYAVDIEMYPSSN